MVTIRDSEIHLHLNIDKEEMSRLINLFEKETDKQDKGIKILEAILFELKMKK